MKLFRILHDIDIDREVEYDATTIEVEGYEKLPYYFIDSQMYPVDYLPKQLVMKGDFNALGKTDYPFTNSGITIIRDKVYEQIFRDTAVDHTMVPVICIENSSEEAFLKHGDYKDSETIRSFVAIRLENIAEGLFDFEKSEYKMSRRFPGELGRIKSISLKMPSNGFDPIFRISESVANLFIREDVVKKLIDVGIKGCKFEEVEVT